MNVRSVLDSLGIHVAREEGDHLWALCPFHEDQTPSWRIRKRGSRAGLHFCFACKEGGNVVDLVKHVVGYGTRGAAQEWLEKRGEVVVAADLEVFALEMREASARDRSFRMPVGFEDPALDEWPGPVLEYALSSRGLAREQVAKWGIGFALEGRLAGRMVVPVYDRDGELRSYMARALPGSPGRRYLYPSEREGADPGAMFGEQGWPPVDRRDEVVVTEGAFKSLAVERAIPGMRHGALGGSQVKPAHVLRLSTWRRVVVLADGDGPGELAGDALVAALRGHVEVVRCRLEGTLQADEVEPGHLAEAVRRAS